MERSLAIDLIKEFEEEGVPTMILREIPTISPKQGRSLTVIGPRRAGKTYFMYEMINRGSIPISDLVFLDLEDDRIYPPTTKDIDDFLRIHDELYSSRVNMTRYVFLDEIQNVDGWERFVRRIIKEKRNRVFLTGSSSRMLAKEIATAMRGRSLSNLVLPFSFRECLGAWKIPISEDPSPKSRTQIVGKMDEYLECGGFPDVVQEDEPRTRVRILKEYVETMLLRDVIERNKVTEPQALRVIMNGLISSFSKEVPLKKYHGFLKSIGIGVSKNKVYEYSEYLMEAMMFFKLKKIGGGYRTVEGSFPKVYLIDNGMATQYGMNYRENRGRFFENALALEFLRMTGFDTRIKLDYWKDTYGREVDFVLKTEGKVRLLVQSCVNLSDPQTGKRELDSIVRASEQLQCDNMLIVTQDMDSSIEWNGKTVRVIPLWRYLISDPQDRIKSLF
ncbi:MAG: ATP-binding protein [Candidatus Thermoplasmatota archaeon]|nr:ATP-binding protein [Candidatus Thermoplasmatota archaeon]